MESTKKHFIKRMVFIPMLIAVMIFTAAGPSLAATFKDVDTTSIYYNAVEENASKGYVLGYDDGNFRPNETLSRLHGVLIFSRILHTDKVDKQYFTDVPPSYIHYKTISGIADKGIINGFGDGTFRRYEPLSRGQVALAIYKTFDFSAFDGKESKMPFTDVAPAYVKAVSALYAAKVTSGTTATTFGTDNTITRGQFLVLLSRAMEAIHKDKKLTANVKVNNNQTATVYGEIEDFKLDGTELVNIKIISKKDNKQLVNVDVKPDAALKFTYTTPTLAKGAYEAKVGIVGSTHIETLPFSIDDTVAPAAPGISFVGKSVVGGVVDLLDLQTDLNTRFTYGTTGLTGAQAGDTLKYKVYSDNAVVLDKTVTLTAQDISNGYVQEVIKTNALRNLLGGLLSVQDVLGGVLGASVTAEDVAALQAAAAEGDTVQAAGLLDGILGGGTTTNSGLLGGLLGDQGLVGGLLGGNGGVVGGLLGDNGLLGTGLLGGTSGLLNLDGLLGNVLGLVGIVVDGVLQGVISGAENVTIEAQLIDASGNQSDTTKEVYKFQVTDVLGL
ncbi:S-layer homology domain-containing protein [Bacillus benzoevorans]|uniref:SLH domain-containing protein n=1 Tax=Bacillus benzoevorans TaxID=1456 RepID=A0A7X0HW07_9BACI|nr:S-layer homology domain-containing protein [Bacillus benzoevorans]MBB6446957.1 hypothetical protein [Bacillus benzoevorans]